MKKLMILGGALFMLALAPSCSSTKEGTVNIKTVLKAPMFEEPAIVTYDVDFDKRITGRASGKTKKFTTTETFVDLAKIDAVTNANCDFIFEPSVSVDIRGKNVEVVVSGRAGNYTGLKTIDFKDVNQYNYYFGNQSSKKNEGERLSSSAKTKKGKSKKGGGLFKGK